jgi:PEP-CTERM motif
MKKFIRCAAAAFALTSSLGAQAQADASISEAIDTTEPTLSLLSGSSALTFSSLTTALQGDQSTGTTRAITLSEVSVDLVNKTVYGNVSGSTVVLWTTNIAPTNTPSTGLVITPEAFEQFQRSLSLISTSNPSPSPITLTEGQSLGGVALLAALSLPSVVPEPGTWVMLGLGLACISLVRRQKR